MRRVAFLSCAALLAAIACGGSDSSSVTGSTNNGTGSSPMTASVGGIAWTGTGTGVTYKNNVLSFTGVDIGSGTSITVATTAPGPGTYSLAFANGNSGFAIVAATGSQTWTTLVTGGTGSLVITTLTANHLVATFSFDAQPASGATGVKHVTNGKIDMTF